MRIGYPCINRTIGCKGDRTFRLRSYSEERLVETVEANLSCLEKILRFNAGHDLLYFRITSDLVPFASHPVCTFDWERRFRKAFRSLGDLIWKNGFRITMHPDQFTLINALDGDIVERSVRELDYHARVLDLMGLDETARIQIHVGGVYGDKEESMERFNRNYGRLPERIRSRLVIENDERSYSLKDCLTIHGETGVPILFDVFHHSLLNHGELLKEGLRLAGKTWTRPNGILLVDYSTQKKGARPGSHSETMNLRHFRRFLEESKPRDFDLMLEIKDKEKSALKAAKAAQADGRFRRALKKKP